jgi:hypothetical protein
MLVVQDLTAQAEVVAVAGEQEEEERAGMQAQVPAVSATRCVMWQLWATQAAQQWRK